MNLGNLLKSVSKEYHRIPVKGICFDSKKIKKKNIFFAIKVNKTSGINFIQEAVSIEKEFITESLPCSLIGMNETLMKQYIEYVADRLLQMLKIDPVYKTANPFEWMELISIQGKTNFFEKRVGEYSNKANPGIEEEQEFNMDAEF